MRHDRKKPYRQGRQGLAKGTKKNFLECRVCFSRNGTAVDARGTPLPRWFIGIIMLGDNFK